MAHAARGHLQMQHLNWRCCIMAASQLMHVACDAFRGQSWKWSGMRKRLGCAEGLVGVGGPRMSLDSLGIPGMCHPGVSL